MREHNRAYTYTCVSAFAFALRVAGLYCHLVKRHRLLRIQSVETRREWVVPHFEEVPRLAQRDHPDSAEECLNTERSVFKSRRSRYWRSAVGECKDRLCTQQHIKGLDSSQS